MRKTVPAILLAFHLSTVGCRTPEAPTSSIAPTQTDRLMRAYADLKGGRFAVIADFEDPKQMELIQLISVSHAAGCSLNPKLGRRETGSGCLRFTTASIDDTMVVNNQHAQSWFLKRDWREYDLLLLSVHAPQPGLTVHLTLGAGPPQQRLATETSIPLEKGWNLIRLDLFEAGERIPLDDVQEMRLALSGASKSTEVLMDDLLLTTSREDLLGDSRNREAGLYVQRVGRRWKVGAKNPTADFELTFANGQIVEWYNTSADPHKLRNLVRGTTLGPNPTFMGFDANVPGPVSVRSQIIEMNPVRVVITCERSYDTAATDNQPPAGSTSSHRWVYTLYPTGQMYGAVEDRTRLPLEKDAYRMLTVELGHREGQDLHTYVGSTSSHAGSSAESSYAFVRGQQSGLVLLYAVNNPGSPILAGEAVPQSVATSWEGTATRLAAIHKPSDPEAFRWIWHLFLGSGTASSDEELHSRAASYLGLAPPRVEVGALVDDGAKGPLREGFDPAEGCFVVAPDRGRVKFVIGDPKEPVYSPAFRIVASDQRDAWVYVDHLILKTVARSYQGDLVFQLPGTIRRPALVEILFKSQETRPIP